MIATNCRPLFFLFLTFSNALSAQSISDTTKYNAAISDALAVYHQSSGDQSGIYNGMEYARYPFFIKEGHSYYIGDDFTNGSVLYDGLIYNDIPLLYDEVNDELVTKNIDGSALVKLVKVKVQQFTIYGDVFINIESDVAKSIPPGFYNLLYDGKTKVVRKQTKLLKERIAGNVSEKSISAYTDNYIRVNGIYHKVNSEKALSSAFGEDKKIIAAYLRENKLKFKKDNVNAIIQAAKFHDSTR